MRFNRNINPNDRIHYILFLYIAALLCMSIFALPAMATTETYPADADSMIRWGTAYGSTNYGTQTTIRAQIDAGVGQRWIRSLIRFDLSLIPDGATIESATLYAYKSAYTLTPSVAAYRATAMWNETEVTWDNWDSTALIASGPTDIADTTDAYEWISWNVTEDIQAFVDGTEPNYGWLLNITGDETRPPSSLRATLNSRENSVNPPYLTVIYSTGTGTEIPVANFSGTPTSGTAPLTVTFTDESINDPTSWAWDVDNDGTVDYTTQNATHTYIMAGTYSVTLTATNAAGSDEEVKTDYITVTGGASPATDFTYTSSESGITITGYIGPGGDVIIPDTINGLPVVGIATSAFEDCTALTSVTIPDNVTTIGNYAFFGCTGLTSVTIGNGVTTIGNFAFFGCTGLTSVTIPDSVTSIINYAFSGCTALTSVTIPDSVTTIGDYAFRSTGLTSVTIPDSVTSIGEGAFEGCTALTSVTIGNGVTSIGEGAFYGCTALTSVTIGNGVTSIGNYAFDGCTALTSMVFTGNAPTSVGSEWVNSANAVIYYYEDATGWSTPLWNNVPCYPLVSAPVANFSGTPTSGTAPLTVQFTDLSENCVTSWAWDFDNDGTVDSIARNPGWEYTTAGMYTVNLTVTNPLGSDYRTEVNYITVNAFEAPVANFSANVTTGTAPLTVTFTDESINDPTSWAWDVDNDGTVDYTTQNATHTYTMAGNYTVTLTVTNAAGSDDETKTEYITVTEPIPDIDLTIAGLVNCVPGSAVFAWEPNTVTVANIKNQGTDTATNIVVRLYASDVDDGNTAIAETTIATIAGGGSVSLKDATALTDPMIRTTEGTVTYTAKVDPDNLIAETNEANNNKSSVSKAVRYNGYKGKGIYWVGADNGGNITTRQTLDLNGDIVYYTQPDSAYRGVGWIGPRTETWTAADLVIPDGATVEKALLFFSYNWDQTPGGFPNLETTFNGNTIDLGTPYRDWSNFGAYADYEYGLYPAYDVTGIFNMNGDNTLLTNPGNGGADNKVALYPSTLVVIYSDPAETRKQIFINEEFDYLGVSQSSYGTTMEEATAYVPFSGMTIDTGSVQSATWHSFATNAGPAEGNVFFNGNNIANNVFTGSTYSSFAMVFDVKNYLTATGNEAAVQGTESGGMGAIQQILVVEYVPTVTAPVAAFSGTPTSGTAPLTVTFTDESINDPTSWAWDVDNDGTVDYTTQNATHTYTMAGNYTVTLTVTNAAGSDDETKTDYITVTPAPPSIKVESPDGGETWTLDSAQSITWSYTENPGPSVKIEALKGERVIATIPSVPIGSGGTGFFNLTVPSRTPLGDDYRFRVTSTSNPAYTDVSDAPFTIASPIVVVSPDGGEVWQLGSAQSVQWSYTGNPGSTVKIEALRGETVIATVSSVPIGSGGTGFFNLTVPFRTPLGDNYRFRVTSTSNPAYTDTSNAPFTISADTGSSITIVSPDGGEIWTLGSAQSVQWTYTGNPGSTVKIEALRGETVIATVSSVPIGSGGTGFFNLTVPFRTPLGDNYRFRVTSTSNPAYTDTSNAPFTISDYVE